MIMKTIKSLLTCAVFLASLNLSAQIIYTDIPDTIMVTPTIPGLGGTTLEYVFHMNDDSLPDVIFLMAHYKIQMEDPWLIYTLYAATIETNDSSFIASDEDNCAIMLDLNDTINQNLEGFIDNSGSIFFKDYYNKSKMIMDDLCYTPFSDQYCPIKLVSNSNVHFGWIRLTSNSWAVILKDFAYHATPNMMILAGETGITEINERDVNNPFSITHRRGILEITNELVNNKIDKIRLIAITGQCIKDIEINNFSASINTNNIPAGFYIVQIIQPENIFVKKVFISNN